MKVNVGSQNPAKVIGVKEAFNLYFNNLRIEEINIESGVEAQPKELESITQGAINRARKSFRDCNYSVGVESGIFPVKDALTGYMNASCSVIYDGESIIGMGFSPLFEHLPEIIEKALNSGKEIGEITEDAYNIKDIKKNIGAIGILSQGKYLRKDLVKHGTIMAIIQMINQEGFNSK